ncbi:MAG TPA: hypothetical protein VG101_02815 [Puia sp.]|jgi:hypothetical protein|nr:hypothetical protein [Puia sp.]
MKKPISLSFVPASPLRSAATILSAILLLLSPMANAQSPNPLYHHLPPSANHIYSVRLGQIIAKGELGGIIQGIPIPKDPHGTWFMNILTNPASSGVDLDHEILIAQTTASGDGADTLSYVQIFVPLTDSAKFRSSLKEIKNQHLHRVPGKGVTTYEKMEAMAWNDQLLVMTEASSTVPPSISDSATAYMPGKTPNEKLAPKPKPGTTIHRPTGELAVEKSLSALAGFPNSPWLTDQRFLTGFATNEDVHIWSIRMDFMTMISKLAKKMVAKNPAMQGKPFPDYNNMGQIPHPPVLSTFSFENGRIVFRATTFNKPEDAAVLQRVYDRPINKDLLARVPGGLLLGWGAAHLNTAAFPELLDKYGTRHMLDSILGKKGLSVSDISGIFGGDFLIAALADTTATTDTTKKKVQVYFVATLGDPAKMMQVAAKVVASNGVSDDTAQMAKMKKLADKLVIRDNLLVISGSKELANKYFDNQARRPTGPIETDKSFQRLVIDLKAVSTYAAASMASNPKAMVMARILQQLDKVELNSMSDGNNTVMTFQIVTGDPSTNSLKTLVSLMH